MNDDRTSRKVTLSMELTVSIDVTIETVPDVKLVDVQTQAREKALELLNKPFQIAGSPDVTFNTPRIVNTSF